MRSTLGPSTTDLAYLKGIQEGELKGEIKGQLVTLRENLLVLLTDRFGTLPAELVKRIEEANDVAKLQSAIHKFLQLRTLDELSL